MMDIEPGLMIWTIISFLIFLYLLKKFAWGPILRALDQRESNIKNDLDAAHKARLDAEKSLEEYKKQLADAQAQALQLVSKARQDAERTREDLIAKAKVESQAQVESAKRQIELEKQDAINQIRSELADLIVLSAEKVISRSLDDDKHRQIALESLKEVEN